MGEGKGDGVLLLLKEKGIKGGWVGLRGGLLGFSTQD